MRVQIVLVKKLDKKSALLYFIFTTWCNVKIKDDTVSK